MKKYILCFLFLFSTTVFAQLHTRLSEDKDGVYFITENSFFIKPDDKGRETAGFTLTTVSGMPGQENYKSGVSLYSIPISQCSQEATSVEMIDSNQIVSELSDVRFRGPLKMNLVISAICTMYLSAKKNPEEFKTTKAIFRDAAQNSLEKDWTILKTDGIQSVSILNNSLFALIPTEGKQASTLVARYINSKTGKVQFRKLLVTADNCNNKSGIFRVFLLDNSYEGLQKFAFDKPDIFTKAIEMMCSNYLVAQ